jgi:hypothetical protein
MCCALGVFVFFGYKDARVSGGVLRVFLSHFLHFSVANHGNVIQGRLSNVY